MKIFHPSKSTSATIIGLKTILYSSFFWIVFLLIIPNHIYKFEATLEWGFPSSHSFGLIFFILCSSINIWAGFSMSYFGKGTPLPLDCPNELVISGPYKFVRNPMALGGIGQGISVGIYYGSILVILFSIVGAILWHIIIRPKEEKDLEKRFGSDYISYRQDLQNWIPKFTFL